LNHKRPVRVSARNMEAPGQEFIDPVDRVIGGTGVLKR
jgi:hypothetical protein